jgi:uncharacterized membrane protein
LSKGRLEAFSDGVIAIIITIMVLGLEPPHGASLDDLVPLAPVFLSYVLSFVFIGIYWANHHHLLQAAHVVDGRVLWANLNLLFWLSLVPFGTGWMGANGFATIPVAIYGAQLFLAGTAYFILARALIACQPPESPLMSAIGPDTKGRISLVAYASAIPVALVLPAAAVAIYVLVAAIWFVPDRRIERAIGR